jgi:hypothetical protein
MISVNVEPRKYNPTTSHSGYTSEECQFIKAVEDYKKKTHKKFLNHTDYLAIAKCVGYSKMGFSA